MSASPTSISTITPSTNTIPDVFAKLKTPDAINELINFGIGFVALVITCAVFYIASTDSKALTEQFYIYIVVGIIPTVIGIAIVLKAFSSIKIKNEITAYYNLIFYASVLLIFIISMYMFYRVLNPLSVLYVTYFLGGLSILTLIVGLAIINRIFVRTIINAKGFSGFILRCLFLIPCLFIDGLEYLFNDLKSTPKMVIVLFILEILIILAYIYIPRISKSSDTTVLLNKPVFLSKVTTIGNATQLFMNANDVNNPSKSLTMIRQNYSISMWLYVNQHPNSSAAYSKETNVFRFGYPNSNIGHPRVTYFNDRKNTNKSDKFIVYANETGTPISMKMQAWNYLVISYNDSIADIFVNGNLEKSVSLGLKGDIYNQSDVIEVGQGDNTVTGGGLHGAICNIVYYNTPVTPSQVSSDYNLNRYKNPPINN